MREEAGNVMTTRYVTLSFYFDFPDSARHVQAFRNIPPLLLPGNSHFGTRCTEKIFYPLFALRQTAYARLMSARFLFLLAVCACSICSPAATRVHVVAYGKWTTVQWSPGTEAAGEKSFALKIRPLLVDGRIKEYVIGTPHEVTERMFVARRAFRLNDSLPDDPTPRWQWQRGGWLLVNRLTGKISTINLPEFDALYSAATWYRDYVGYCGISDDGKKIFAIVAQLNRRKPVLKKLLSSDGLPDNSPPDSACTPPAWQKGPIRISFEPPSAPKQTFAIRGHIVDTVADTEEEEDAKD